MNNKRKLNIFISQDDESKIRLYIVVLIFLWFLILAILKLFEFTVINWEYYKGLADRQQLSKTEEPTPRWNIYSNNKEWNTLASSVYLYDLAIDPSLDWDKEMLASFLTDVVFQDICYLKKAADCRKDLTSFMGVLNLPDFSMTKDYLVDKIYSKIIKEVSRTKLTSVLIKSNLTPENIFDIERRNITWLYITGTSLYVNPEEIPNRDETALFLSQVFDGDMREYKNAIRQRDLRYLMIKSRLNISTSKYIEQRLFDESDAIKRWILDSNKAIGQFILLPKEYERYYPEDSLASNVIWFVDGNGVWRYGVEWYYNDILTWKTTQTYIRKDEAWRPLELIESNVNDLNLKWADIALTIDRNIQKTVEEIIDADIKQFMANNISVVVMNPKNGDIVSMASTPRYDLNNPWEAYELEKVTPEKYPNPPIDLLWARVLAIDNRDWEPYIYNWKRIYLREISREELSDKTLEKYVFKNFEWSGVYKNDLIQNLYEPWSIFKPFVFRAGIDAWEISSTDRYQDKWYVQVDNFTIRNVEYQCTWYHTYGEAMDRSCNVGMIDIAQKIGPSIFHKYLGDFGIWSLTGIDLDGEATGRLDPYEKWSKAQLFTTSFGQWISVNMLQIARAYSVIANGWVYYKPQIVKSIKYPDGRNVVNEWEPLRRVLKESTSDEMIKVLVHWVDERLAKAWRVPWYSIGWKTWTREIAYRWWYESGRASTIWLFAWFAPAEDPEFVIIVKVERPRSSIYWANTARKTFWSIAKELFKYYAIPPKDE